MRPAPTRAPRPTCSSRGQPESTHRTPRRRVHVDRGRRSVGSSWLERHAEPPRRCGGHTQRRADPAGRQARASGGEDVRLRQVAPLVSRVASFTRGVLDHRREPARARAVERCAPVRGPAGVTGRQHRSQRVGAGVRVARRVEAPGAGGHDLERSAAAGATTGRPAASASTSASPNGSRSAQWRRTCAAPAPCAGPSTRPRNRTRPARSGCDARSRNRSTNPGAVVGERRAGDVEHQLGHPRAIASARSARFHGTSAPSTSARGGPGRRVGQRPGRRGRPRGGSRSPHPTRSRSRARSRLRRRRAATRPAAARAATASGGRSWCSAIAAGAPPSGATRPRGSGARRRRRRPPVAAAREPATSRARPASSAVAAAVRPRRRSDRARSGTTGAVPLRPASGPGGHASTTAPSSARPSRAARAQRRRGRPLAETSSTGRSRIAAPGVTADPRSPAPARRAAAAAARVAPQQRMARGAASRTSVACAASSSAQRRAAARRADHGAAAPRQQRPAARRRARRVTAGVADAQLRVQDGGTPGGARAQAQVHVLREQVHRGVERAEPRAAPPSCRRGMRRSPSRQSASRSARYGSTRSRSGSRAAAAGAAGRRAARRSCRAAGARSAGRLRRRRAAAARAARPAARRTRPTSAPRRAVEQLAVGVQQDADVVARPLDARVAGRAEARDCRAARRPRRPSVRGDVRAVVARAGVDDDDLGPLGRERARASAAASLSSGAESCSTTTTVYGTRRHRSRR